MLNTFYIIVNVVASIVLVFVAIVVVIVIVVLNPLHCFHNLMNTSI